MHTHSHSEEPAVFYLLRAFHSASITLLCLYVRKIAAWSQIHYPDWISLIENFLATQWQSEGDGVVLRVPNLAGVTGAAFHLSAIIIFSVSQIKSGLSKLLFVRKSLVGPNAALQCN